MHLQVDPLAIRRVCSLFKAVPFFLRLNHLPELPVPLLVPSAPAVNKADSEGGLATATFRLDPVLLLLLGHPHSSMMRCFRSSVILEVQWPVYAMTAPFPRRMMICCTLALLAFVISVHQRHCCQLTSEGRAEQGAFSCWVSGPFFGGRLYPQKSQKPRLTSVHELVVQRKWSFSLSLA